MKINLSQIGQFSVKINRQHIQLVWTVIALALLVLGTGAPFARGGGSG
jgi:hypothetical protein